MTESTQAVREAFEDKLLEFAWCVTDERKAVPWTNELADKTEAARAAVIEEFASKEAECERMQNLCETLRQEARNHAHEAAGHRATVQEIYQLISGATGEPGDWNGAAPVRELLAECERLREALDDMIKWVAVYAASDGPAARRIVMESPRMQKAQRALQPQAKEPKT
jgi:light-regulated signal transduction histidine kinase (bacteriophytochrome)